MYYPKYDPFSLNLKSMINTHQLVSHNATESHYGRSRTESGLPLTKRLSARGIRLTQKRKILLQILEEAESHLDAAAILEIAKQRMKVDRATVYRTLDLLKKEGLVDELDLMHLRGEMHYYEARTDNEHFHLACFACGKIEEVESPFLADLKEQVTRERGFVVASARLEMGGICSKCAVTVGIKPEARLHSGGPPND
jgi:Fur family ferric uptake transcriptional regulator